MVTPTGTYENVPGAGMGSILDGLGRDRLGHRIEALTKCTEEHDPGFEPGISRR